jgi:hypothetical protein
MPQTCKQSSAKAKEYKRSRNANLSTSKTPINHESQMNYHREKKKSHHNDDSSHSSTGDMGKTDRKKRGGKLKSSSTKKSPNTEDIDSDRDSISSTSEGSYVRRSLIRFGRIIVTMTNPHRRHGAHHRPLHRPILSTSSFMIST